MLTWGIAVFAAVLGSGLLLLRKKIAVLAFTIGLIALIATSLHNFILAETKINDIVNTGALIFTLAIFVVSILLLFYAKKQADAGVLT